LWVAPQEQFRNRYQLYGIHRCLYRINHMYIGLNCR
jgi:hypothetical protein